MRGGSGMTPLHMDPAPGARALHFVGDVARFSLRMGDRPWPRGWRAFLRTNLGRGPEERAGIIRAFHRQAPIAGAAWRDIPLAISGSVAAIETPLVETGFYKAKAYALDPDGFQHWPEGPDAGLSIHPDAYRTGNTIYCAFPRLFGPARDQIRARRESRERLIARWDRQGYTVIPPSGKLRDLARQIPHIVGTLGCRILHLLPVNPTPATYARMGRHGSPYAALDFTAVDPALVEFDRRTTGVDQFMELADAAHAAGGRLFLDLAINHTGWGSVLQETHPEWFLRGSDGTFLSPGAWGTTWEDLVELAHRTPDLWDHLAGAFLTWCDRGVDGFRCDAGYKVPLPAWQYIIARIRDQFPETIFLLEGLGGPWSATEEILTEGGMQWAYSELFQNFSGLEIASYLDYCLPQSRQRGLWIHYSETHDNRRLAEKGRAWSLLRNRVCALASVSGGFGFACGVEWLAPEKIDVHATTGLAWGQPDNIVPEIAALNQLVSEHPAFFDGARIERLSAVESDVLVLLRESADGQDRVLVLVNADVQHAARVIVPPRALPFVQSGAIDLLGQTLPAIHSLPGGGRQVELAPASCHCLAVERQPRGLAGDRYRQERAAAAWAVEAIVQTAPAERLGALSWLELAALVRERGPFRFLAALDGLAAAIDREPLIPALRRLTARDHYPAVIVWRPNDLRRITLIPPGHWLLIECGHPFRARVHPAGGRPGRPLASQRLGGVHCAAFPPQAASGDSALRLQILDAPVQRIEARLRWLSAEPDLAGLIRQVDEPGADAPGLFLLTNGRGAMARLHLDLGRIESKYDCLLAANLNPDFPVDRHVLAKRARVWVNADGFLSPLDGRNLAFASPGPPARWEFVANAGDGRCVEIHLEAEMPAGLNVVRLRFLRPAGPPRRGRDLPASADVRLTVRIDVEDRNYHQETHRNAGAEHHFSTHTRLLPDAIGFEFTPVPDRRLQVQASAGRFHPQPEWCDRISHPIEQTRGQVAEGDAYSPGWFELPLRPGAEAAIELDADPVPASGRRSEHPPARVSRIHSPAAAASAGTSAAAAAFMRHLAAILPAYLVRRNPGRTVIAGYPWFLDWGRDTLICARGLLAAGYQEDVRQILLTFARLERDGTLPNAIHGENTSNRDTSDAPLWFGLVCEEYAQRAGADFYRQPAGNPPRTVADVLVSIARGYHDGTPNGIRMDPESALVWSPAHFTWMDTNHPAATPREGYPVEIQALWIRLLKQLACGVHPASRRSRAGRIDWAELAARAEASFQRWFWLEAPGHLADVLEAGPGTPAPKAFPSPALRSNMLLAVSLGLVEPSRARRCVAAAQQHLLVPGALRSLAPLPATPPLPVRAADGRLLNNPDFPYWGEYAGDEDTRRKPAYHNGTAWVWTLPVFAEAMAVAWDFEPAAVAAARAYLGSLDRLIIEGCAGHLPEIVDGDAPHAQRGCDAQAWSATESLRVWQLLDGQPHRNARAKHDQIARPNR